MFSPSRGLDSFDQYLQDVEKYPLIQDPVKSELWPGERAPGTRKPPSGW